MRIVHFSDVHIGVENFSRIDLESGLSTRLLDFLETLDEVVDYCIENEVSLALFCGDAYKSQFPHLYMGGALWLLMDANYGMLCVCLRQG